MTQFAEKRRLDKIIPVRLNAGQWKTIKIEAERKGIGISTLTRMWILEYIDKMNRKKH